MFASINWVSEEYGITHYKSDYLHLKRREVISPRLPSNGHQCVYDSTTTGSCNPPFSFHRKLKRSQAKKYLGREKIVYTTKLSGFKSFRIQSSHFKFRIQHLRRHDQTGEFLFRIRPLLCKRQNQSGTKTFRIHHESGTISSSVNLQSMR